MLQHLIALDKSLFTFINGKMANPFFDWLMPWLRNAPTWAPLYLFVIVYLLVNYKTKGAWLIVTAVITVLLTDQISSHLIKVWVARTRPCNDISLIDTARFLLNYRPQSFSFTSSHATNHFGFAMLMYRSLRVVTGKWIGVLFVWAGLISLAQVYVGVHFPLDILCGGLLGCAIGYATSQLYVTATKGLHTV